MNLDQQLANVYEQIEAYEFADPPQSPPAELLERCAALRSQINDARKAKLGPPKIRLIPVEPLRTEATIAFVDGPGRHGVETIDHHVYPPSPRGEAMAALRRHHGVSIGSLARALGVESFSISDLERGRVTTDNPGWTLIIETIGSFCETGKRNK